MPTAFVGTIFPRLWLDPNFPALSWLDPNFLLYWLFFFFPPYWLDPIFFFSCCISWNQFFAVLNGTNFLLYLLEPILCHCIFCNHDFDNTIHACRPQPVSGCYNILIFLAMNFHYCISCYGKFSLFAVDVEVQLGPHAFLAWG